MTVFWRNFQRFYAHARPALPVCVFGLPEFIEEENETEEKKTARRRPGAP